MNGGDTSHALLENLSLEKLKCFVIFKRAQGTRRSLIATLCQLALREKVLRLIKRQHRRRSGKLSTKE